MNPRGAVVWTNWAGDQRCVPESIERPRSEDEVAAIVGRAAESGRRVRAVGAGHSFTDIACTDGVMVDLSAMREVIDHDPQSGLVRMQSGASVHRLGAMLEERGLALQNQGDIDKQAIAGALATATHGTGARFGNISSRVEGIRLVDGRGDVVELTADSDAGALRAARVGLGVLGVITEVTVRCVELFTINRVDEKRPLREVLDRLDELVDGHDHFEFFVFPYSDVALARSSRRTSDEPSPRGRLHTALVESGIENAVLSAVCRTGRRAPRLVPRLNRVLPALMPRHAEKVDRSWRVYAATRKVHFTEMEYAIPLAAAREAVERVLAMIERRRLPVNFPLEVRWAAADDAYLSTAHARETCYVAVHQYSRMEFESYFRAVERIMDDYDGRPHWGKRHYQSAATLGPRYPEWDAFQDVRARFDPGGVFANDYTDRVLGEPR